MIKMIIVDDERIIRESLNKFIDWKSIDVEVVGIADNGSTAIDLILNLQPDIVLSDIAMPQLNGIEMAALLRSHNIDAQIIFISAYSSFEYAKSAIQYGAFDYILKPIDEVHLLETVRLCVEKIKTARIQSKMLSRFTQDQENKLQALLHHIICSEEVTKDDWDLLSSDNISEDDYLNVVGAGIWYHNGDPCTLSWFENLMNLMNFNYRLLCVRLSDNQQALICLDTSEISEKLEREFYIYLQKLKDENKQNGVDLTVTMSKAYPFKEAFHALYTEISLPLVYDGFDAGQSIRCFNIIERQGHPLSSDNITSIAKKLVKETEFDKVPEGIRAFFLQMVSNHIIYDLALLKLKCIELIDAVIQQLNDYRIKDFLNQDSLTGKKNINSQRSVDKVYEVTRNIILNLTSYLSELHSKSTNRIVMLALEFVHQNYNKDITLTQLAEQLYVSPNYLSKIFSNKVNQTFSHYLLEYRIEESKKFLLEPKYKIYEVAELTGFSDVAHFSKSFKQIVGVSPHQFKNN